jgi:SAM-dependent methyltransferase
MLRTLKSLLSVAKPSEIGLALQTCPICQCPVLLRLSGQDIGTRCIRCRASSVHMALAATIQEVVPDLRAARVYELSSRGPIVNYLRRNAAEIVVSEYYDDAAPGDSVNGVRCENVEALTFPDDAFDLCTSTDVFEHVADDMAGFREIYRVLRSGGGKAIFTVPLSSDQETVERARRRDGKVHHLLEPEYHHDIQRGIGKVLAFRNYGSDIVLRLQAAGFSRAYLYSEFEKRFMGFGRVVVVAEKV